MSSDLNEPPSHAKTLKRFVEMAYGFLANPAVIFVVGLLWILAWFWVFSTLSATSAEGVTGAWRLAFEVLSAVTAGLYWGMLRLLDWIWYVMEYGYRADEVDPESIKAVAAPDAAYWEGGHRYKTLARAAKARREHRKRMR